MNPSIIINEFFSPSFHLEVKNLTLITPDIFCFLPTKGETVMLTTDHVFGIDDQGITRDWNYISKFSSIFYDNQKFEILDPQSPETEQRLNDILYNHVVDKDDEDTFINNL